MLEVARLGPRAGEVPGGVSRLAEEAAAHVVVDAQDAPAEAVERLHRLGADEAASAPDEYGLLLGHLTFPRGQAASHARAWAARSSSSGKPRVASVSERKCGAPFSRTRTMSSSRRNRATERRRAPMVLQSAPGQARSVSPRRSAVAEAASRTRA